MSLMIDIDNVTAVLLADGWHQVHGDSFDLDAYEYIQAPKPYEPSLDVDRRGRAAWESQVETLLGGGREQLVPATGFSFHERVGGPTNIVCISGPLTSILAVRTRVRRQAKSAA